MLTVSHIRYQEAINGSRIGEKHPIRERWGRRLETPEYHPVRLPERKLLAEYPGSVANAYPKARLGDVLGYTEHFNMPLLPCLSRFSGSELRHECCLDGSAGTAGPSRLERLFSLLVA